MTTALEPELSTYRWSSHDEADRFPVEDPATGEVGRGRLVLPIAGRWLRLEGSGTVGERVPPGGDEVATARHGR
jgi:hypothetical protein